MESKKALDRLIKIARVHFYKPIQIAEILYQDREGSLALADVESYRNASRKWRDQITHRLVGRISTSSQKYQDNIFDKNAMPPSLLVELARFNREHNGAVEAFIYKSLQHRLSLVHHVKSYLEQTRPETFQLLSLLQFFESRPGLKRSVDKMYEITVYALFSTIVRVLDITVTLEIGNREEEVLRDFNTFIKVVLGVDLENQHKITKQAALYRVGVTNAADRGLDMIANFGTVIQVKHLKLDAEKAQEITEGLAADGIVIVCVDAEKDVILSVLTQLGLDQKVQGIITLGDLQQWYETCFREKYRSTLGNLLLADLRREVEQEFPSSLEIEPFLKERGYDRMIVPPGWDITAE